jgi:2-polyprenyl-3-methyl-5-hydroxy-6-metoxy-1,4-benzoquinol methylase
MMSFDEHISDFNKRIQQIAPAEISDNAYCVRYFAHLQTHLQYYLKIYTVVLNEALSNSRLSKEKVILLDYGTGNGLLGIFAKYCGFGYVIGYDIDADFVKAAGKLSSILNIEPDEWICGDADNLKAKLGSKKINIVVGTDVIEHIYNLYHFFDFVASMGNDIVTVFTTASNPENPFKVRKLKQLQWKDEYFGASPQDAVLCGGETHEAYFTIRNNIIKAYFPQIDTHTRKELTLRTRGLKKNEIIHSVEIYLQHKLMPEMPAHPTNTCNPYTGSWTERILTLDEYKSIYADKGFELNIICGFYNNQSSGLKSAVASGFNFLIRFIGMKIAPFIILVGKKQHPGNES